MRIGLVITTPIFSYTLSFRATTSSILHKQLKQPSQSLSSNSKQQSSLFTFIVSNTSAMEGNSTFLPLTPSSLPYTYSGFGFFTFTSITSFNGSFTS